MSSIKMRATLGDDGVTTVKVLISHPMDTGLEKDKKTGNLIPAHFIQEVVCEHNGTKVMTDLIGAMVERRLGEHDLDDEAQLNPVKPGEDYKFTIYNLSNELIGEIYE